MHPSIIHASVNHPCIYIIIRRIMHLYNFRYWFQVDVGLMLLNDVEPMMPKVMQVKFGHENVII